MDIFIKELGHDAVLVNKPGWNNGTRPFFMTHEELEEILTWQVTFGFDQICWEGNIIAQIWENKYNWFDFSKDMIDIGAGAGEYPTFLNFNHCYAFEPNKRKQCLIYANILSHDRLYNVDVMPYGISDNPGIREFNGWSEDKTHERDNGDNVIQTVEFKTLDSFNFNNIGFIKADIEGFEYNALHSGIGTIIRNNFPPILVEIWGESDTKRYRPDNYKFYLDNQKNLVRLLYSLGYVWIRDKQFGDVETFFFIHKTQLNGYTQPEESK